MDLASKTKLIKSLKEIKDCYNKDTDVGQNIREGFDICITYIEDAFSGDIFSLEYLGESNLIELLKNIKIKLDKLNEEPEIQVFKIEGFLNDRYTECYEKAKEILKEEFKEMIDNIDEDWAESKLEINMKSIKNSNLKDYKIEA
jgi:hypothetical protein